MLQESGALPSTWMGALVSAEELKDIVMYIP